MRFHDRLCLNLLVYLHLSEWFGFTLHHWFRVCKYLCLALKEVLSLEIGLESLWLFLLECWQIRRLNRILLKSFLGFNLLKKKILGLISFSESMLWLNLIFLKQIRKLDTTCLRIIRSKQTWRCGLILLAERKICAGFLLAPKKSLLLIFSISNSCERLLQTRENTSSDCWTHGIDSFWGLILVK